MQPRLDPSLVPGSTNPPAEDPVSLWNRRILSILGLGFLVMSWGVFLDPGASGQAKEHSTQGLLGKQVWLDKNCMVCHQFYGMGGYLGPDLTNVSERLGAETVAWVLRNGRGSMPDLDLSDEEVFALVVFLEEMGDTGVFPQKSWPPGWFPPVRQPLPGS